MTQSIITMNDNGLFQYLSSGFKKVLPNALANGLNTVAFSIMRDVKNVELGKKLTLRNKFTATQFQVDPATKTKPWAELGFTTKAHYMETLNAPTAVRPRHSKYIPIPTNFARKGNNKLGLRRRAVTLKAIAKKLKPNTWVANTPSGKKAIMINAGTKKQPLPKVLYYLVPVAHYKKAHFPLEKVIEQEARKYNFEHVMMKALLTTINRGRP